MTLLDPLCGEYLDRAKLDNNGQLLDFTEKLEAACIGTVESGRMTKDLALLIFGSKYILTCHYLCGCRDLLFSYLVQSSEN